MIAYRGFLRTTEVVVSPEDLGCGAGRVPCFECGGTGRWGSPPEVPEDDCVDCKGSGAVLISI